MSHLINRILDANVFGSGHLDRNLPLHMDDEENRSWFGTRRISYYHMEEKGIVFLQFSSSQCHLTSSTSVGEAGLDSILEKHDSEDLRGMLLMFSVSFYMFFGFKFASDVICELFSIRIDLFLTPSPVSFFMELNT